MTPEQARFLSEHPQYMPRAMRMSEAQALEAEADELRRRGGHPRPVQADQDRPVDWDGESPMDMSEAGRSEALSFAEAVHADMLGRLRLGTELDRLAAAIAAYRAEEFKAGEPSYATAERVKQLEEAAADRTWEQAYALATELLDSAGIPYCEDETD